MTTAKILGPTVEQYMTLSPHSIGLEQSVQHAAERMTALHVRHLPVLHGGQLVGVVSERDVSLIGTLMPDEVGEMTVEEVMTGVPYCVEPSTPLAEVARHMASRKLGSAIVTHHDRVVGVFTITDALRALCEAIEANDHPSGTQGDRLTA